jgi:AcrR family transcriptional regulator
MTKLTLPVPDPAIRTRILKAAHDHLFTYGYSALIMDDLARELGVSKKTLYVHFRSKDELVEAVLDGFALEIRQLADQLFIKDEQSFSTKFRRLVAAMIKRFSKLNPVMLRDLQRFAPQIYAKIDDLRRKNIPYVFGRALRDGQELGAVRSDIDPTFAIEFWRIAISGLLQPDNLERLGLPPDQVFEKALNLFFAGLLTPAGRKDYEKHHVS